jgi:uncharacterized membrane-anchored protein
MPTNDKDNPLWLLAGGLLFFTVIVIAVAAWMPANASINALFSGILGNFSGGLMVYLRLSPPNDPSGGAA